MKYFKPIRGLSLQSRNTAPLIASIAVCLGVKVCACEKACEEWKGGFMLEKKEKQRDMPAELE